MDKKIKKAIGLTILAVPGIVGVVTLLGLAVLAGATQGLLWCLGLREATLGSGNLFTESTEE